MRTLSATFFLLFLTAFSPAASAAELPAAFKLPVWGNEVEKVCPWKSVTEEGYIRLIRTENNEGRQALYVQWIKQGIAGNDPEIVATRQLDSMEAHNISNLTMPESFLSSMACHLTTDADNAVNDRRYRFVIELKGPGEMSVAVTRMFDEEMQAETETLIREEGWVRVD